MEKSTKIALGIAAAGYAVNRYEHSKMGEQPFLSQQQTNLKMTGGAVAFLGVATAGILEATKNSPKGRKIAFIGLGGLSAAWVLAILYALRKMS
jgi:hypothetical protein